MGTLNLCHDGGETFTGSFSVAVTGGGVTTETIHGDLSQGTIEPDGTIHFRLTDTFRHDGQVQGGAITGTWLIHRVSGKTVEVIGYLHQRRSPGCCSTPRGDSGDGFVRTIAPCPGAAYRITVRYHPHGTTSSPAPPACCSGAPFQISNLELGPPQPMLMRGARPPSGSVCLA